MLPSGNDSAHCLAEYFGGILKQQAEEQEEQERKDLQIQREELLKQREIEEAIIYREDEAQKELKESTIEGESIANLTTAEGSNAAASQSSAEGGVNAPSKLKQESLKRLDQISKSLMALREKEYPAIKRSPYVVKGSQFKNYPEVLYFLQEMNITAEKINLKGSFYDSPHGLSNYNNK